MRPGSCETDDDCGFVSGLTCCKTKGGNLCVDADPTACLALQVGACATDGDCSGTTPICCPAGPIKLCMISCE